jgi:hypothetical protein
MTNILRYRVEHIDMVTTSSLDSILHLSLSSENLYTCAQDHNANILSYRSLVEVDLGIICACIPTIKPLFNQKSVERKAAAVTGVANSDNIIGSRSKMQSRTNSLDEYPLTEIEDD